MYPKLPETGMARYIAIQCTITEQCSRHISIKRKQAKQNKQNKKPEETLMKPCFKTTFSETLLYDRWGNVHNSSGIIKIIVATPSGRRQVSSQLKNWFLMQHDHLNHDWKSDSLFMTCHFLLEVNWGKIWGRMNWGGKHWKGWLPGSRQSMQSYILAYSRFNKGNFW